MILWFELMKDRWYDLKWTIKNYWTYRKIVSEMRPWDYYHTMKMLKFNIDSMADGMEKYNPHVGSSEKVESLRRASEILGHITDDNYEELCGFVYGGYDDIKFGEFTDESGRKLFKMVDGRDDDTKEANREAMAKAIHMSEKETDELFDIMKDFLGWWY